jgi:hypothetical protein
VIVPLTVLSYALGWLIGLPALLPVLNTLASYPLMIRALRRGDLRLAVTRMILWAMTMGVMATLMAYARPWQSGALFLRGDAYRSEMFAWVMTGRGAESSPSIFIPQQARDAAVFAALAIATAGAAAMPMGAVLMNQMGCYVGSLAAASSHPLLATMLGWHPWAIIRVVSFVTIGVVLSIPLLTRLRVVALVDRREQIVLLSCACAGLIADVALKSVGAPFWQQLLLRATGW